jgi:hypothetical protein
MELKIAQIPNEKVVRIDAKDGQISFRAEMVTTEFWKFVWEQTEWIKKDPARVAMVEMTMKLEKGDGVEAKNRFRHLSVTMQMPVQVFLAMGGEQLRPV